MIKRTFLFAAFLLVCGVVFAGNTVPEETIIKNLIANPDDNAVIETNGYIYVKAKYEMGESESIDNAKKGAMAKAIEIILGMKNQKAQHYTDIFKKMKAGENQSSTLIFNSQNCVSLGVITEQKLLAVIENNLAAREYSVVMKAAYMPIEGSGEPLYFLDASINKSFFVENEAIRISVKVQQAGYLYIFSVAEDGMVYPVYPHSYMKSGQNKIEANQELVLPTKEDKSKGVNYIAMLPAGQTVSCEYLKAIVTDKPNLFIGVKTYEDMMNWLARLKREEFEYVDLGYMIQKGK
ncbi:MAG: DUF4384 domain-containing protein [Brevinematales bacterium]|nr:DUF4384 domain-containing protein [Brevinematales bacterium]